MFRFSSLSLPGFMGIINVTPDSFSDGGTLHTPEDALKRAETLISSGACMLDIGAESTRPGATAIDAIEEMRRLTPVLSLLRKNFPDVPISVDTRRALTAGFALENGANVINDVSGGLYDADMLPTVARYEAGLIIMHSRADPSIMQSEVFLHYDDLFNDIADFLQHRLSAAYAAGFVPDQLALDPGIGFSKTAQQNFDIITRVSDFVESFNPVPIVLGYSLKRFLGQSSDVRKARTARLSDSLYQSGLPLLLRVHTVNIHEKKA